MRIIAYKTDCCKEIKEQERVVGLIMQPGLFEDQTEFKTVACDKAPIHYCLDCYKSRVLDPVNYLVNKLKNREKWQEKHNEYAYVFHKSLYSQNIKRILENKQLKNLQDPSF